MAKKKIGFGDLYCVNCGEGIEKNAEICPRCGRRYDDLGFNGAELLGAGGIGWSDKVDDPCFQQKSKKNVIGMLVIMMIVSVIICAVIYFTSKMELEQLLPIFGGVMAIIWTFWLIWLIVQYAKRSDWEGVVESKECYEQKHTSRDQEGRVEAFYQTVYKVRFRLNSGKRKTLTAIEHSEWYDYLHEGDRVRYHGKNMNYYEKFDKSRDPYIPCAFCGMSRDPRENYCGKCGCVILKAPNPSTARQTFANQMPIGGGVPYAVPISEPSKNQPTTANPASPKFCPNCGVKVSGGRFCTSCGAKLI